jgi:hypothetical protein
MAEFAEMFIAEALAVAVRYVVQWLLDQLFPRRVTAAA